jgi:hypothetical protein
MRARTGGRNVWLSSPQRPATVQHVIPVDSAPPPRQPTHPGDTRPPTPRLPRVAALACLALSTLCLATRPTPCLAASDSTPATPPAISPPSSPPAAPASIHWSFQPVAPPTPPLAGHPIDAFITSALRARGLEPAPPASDRDLVRRLHFDLIGLPPTPEAIEAFTRDTRPDRWERLIDHLLAQPQYGERWAATGWTPSATPKAGLRVRPPPRQRVALPGLRHPQFQRRQTLRPLHARTGRRRHVLQPVTPTALIGPSLLVCGPYDEAGNAQANATQRMPSPARRNSRTLIGTVGQTFLGLTINCARCHDHKFDPIPLDPSITGSSPCSTASSTANVRSHPPLNQAREDAARALRASHGGTLLANASPSPGRKAAASPSAPTAAPPGPIPRIPRTHRLSPNGTSTQPNPVPPDGHTHGGARARPRPTSNSPAGAYFQSSP